MFEGEEKVVGRGTWRVSWVVSDRRDGEVEEG